ncbi:MAG: hypothetical protein ABI668_00095 [Sphingorhabdus sp.]
MGRHSLPLQPVLLLWLAISAILIWSGWTQIVTLSGWDPDDQLRLVQLRDFLGGQSWFDTTQYRMNAPEGAPMHWSRLIELPLAIVVLLLSPIFGQPVADMIAGTLIPLFLLGGIAYILGRIAARLGNREAGTIAVLLTLISPALLMQLRPMRIDHHGWQIFFAVLALWTMFWPDKKRGGLTLGFALAIWLHISLEGAPMTAAFFLLLGWRWVVEKAHGQRLIWTITAFTLTSAALFLGTQPDMLAAHCDSISPPHLVAILLATAIMLPSIVATPDHRRWRMAAVLAAGAVALAAILLIAPQCASGAFGGLDPLVHEYWYQHIKEGLPVWHQSWRNALVLSAILACGLVALFAVQSKSVGSATKDMRLAGYFLIYAALLSLLVFRTVAVASAFAVPLIAVWVSNLFQSYRRSRVPAQRVRLVALMLFLLVPGAVVGQLYSAGSFIIGQKPDVADPARRATADRCEAPPSVAALGTLPKARFVAPFDMGPTILLATQHQVLASSHHRNVQGMHDHIAIFRSSPDTAHAIIMKRGITHIAACPGEAELGFYARKDPAGLWAQLSNGKMPAWLEPLPDMGDGIKVWRVR